MGSGASFDTGIGLDNEQYFCHACHRVFPLAGASSGEMSCPHCASTFLEEVRGIRQHDVIPVNRNRHLNPFGTDGTILTTEQSRRMNSAAAMLRLLEAQLREELEHMNFAFQNPQTTLDSRHPTKPKFSKIMAGKLRSCVLDVDIVCSQPSCPICSEDFQAGNEESKLPCGHFFHRACVVPWLEMKQNCPICRTCLTDEIPSIPDLAKLSLQDLNGWMDLMQSEDAAEPKTVTVARVMGTAAEGGENSTVPKSARAESKDAHGERDDGAQNKESKEDAELTTRTAMATKLQKQLQDYERATLSVAREEERRQVEAHNAFAHLQRARLQSLDEQITDYLSWRSREEATPARSALLQLQAPSSSQLQGSPTRGADSSNSIAAALRRGLFTTTTSTSSSSSSSSSSNNNNNSTAVMTAPNHHSIHIHPSNSNYRMSNSASTLTGSTRTANGTEVLHRIRIVDENSDDEDEDSHLSDEENNEALQALYRRANADHMSRFNFQTLGGLNPPTTSNMGGIGTRSFTERSNLIGAGTRRREAENSNMMEIFNRALYPEMSEPDTEDWGEQLSQIDGSSQRRRAFNSVTSSASARETTTQPTSSPTRPHGAASLSFSAAEAIERSAEQHHHARAAASAFAPTTDALDDHIHNTMAVTALASANLAAGRSTLDTAAAAVATAATSAASERLSRIDARVSAIDRYMTLTGPALYGTNSSASSSSTSFAGNTSSAPAGSIGTTYQVRASGNGGYNTVAVNSSGAAADV